MGTSGVGKSAMVRAFLTEARRRRPTLLVGLVRCHQQEQLPLRTLDAVVDVDLTFTATGCPCMDYIREDVTDRLTRESWIDRVVIHEVWDPPWTNERITPEGRAKLRDLGVGV